eukprot:CAMPEP_0201560904 /NCGR_PEP_ID=MMETSP0173_2-20130828/78507_1 /ASSEMBLY_ACC=CAM_ASM_000268 /TAXON_ID=218659 /ORGANISM="Vexillifera sp., Strain DIVA3 564/2" /LENGTH=471 /DNA_ID=CAMNT_0047975369 /DNA_START=30 /DNA_END=1445 /DNA_ORIENTATION=-
MTKLSIFLLPLFLFLLLSPSPIFSSPIKHIVVLMMENRAFDHLLGWSNNPDIDGLDASLYNLVNVSDPLSKRVYISKDGYNISPDDPRHDYTAQVQQIYGGNTPNDQPLMNGFVANAVSLHHNISNPMAAFTPKTAPVINALADEYLVFDHWFCSLPGPTDPNRAFAMSGTSNGIITNYDGNPWTQQSYFDLLSKHNVTWNAYYQDDPWAVLYFNDTLNNPANRQRIHHLDDFFKDLESGQLSQFVWLQPRMNDHPIAGPATWQHPTASVSAGEHLYKTVYEALRRSKHWENTMFVLTYDEHGGFYSKVAPPQTGIPNPDTPPKNAPNGFSFERLGVRIPTIVISPWVRRGMVVHDQFEATSTIATANKIFGIDQSLSARMSWAPTFEGFFASKMRTDCPKTLPPIYHDPNEDAWRQSMADAEPTDHVQIQVRYYCELTATDVEGCIDAVKTNRDAALFIERIVPVVLKGE